MLFGIVVVGVDHIVRGPAPGVPLASSAVGIDSCSALTGGVGSTVNVDGGGVSGGRRRCLGGDGWALMCTVSRSGSQSITTAGVYRTTARRELERPSARALTGVRCGSGR